MGLTLSAPPGFNDLADSVLTANSPALGIQLAKVYENSCFSMARTEVFSGVYANGDTVSLPVSTRDGYAYSRSELIYCWFVRNSTNPSTLWISASDSLYYCAWLVDQNTGQVFCDEWYRRSGNNANVTHTNDGKLQVWTIAQRQRANLGLAASPTYSAITGSWIGLDKPLTQQLAQGLNDDAKFAVLNHEVTYLGEYSNGQTVTLPISPEDGYHYSAAECKFMLSWRWTATGSVTPLQAPSIAAGQMGPLKASINGSGVVSCSVAMIDSGGNLTTLTSLGRVAAFAFCRRSATPGTITPTANQFAELSFDGFMPGSNLPFANVTQIENNILEGLLTPEYFASGSHANGDTIALPTSAIDGYVYSRSELQYLYFWSDTTNQTGTDLRMPLFFGHIDETTGVVTINVWRLPPGGPYVDDNNTLCRITVLIVATRAAAAASALSVPSTSAPSGATTTGGNVIADVAGFLLEVNGSTVTSTGTANLSDSTPAAATGMRNAKWQKDALSPTDISAEFPNIGGVDARTTTTETVGLSSQGKLVTLNNAGAVAVSLDSTVSSSFFCAAGNLGAGVATLTPSSGTINGGANLALSNNQACWLFFDGTNWEAILLGSGLASSAWSSLTNPTGNLSLTMGANTSLFTYGATTGTNDLFKLTDTLNNTGSGALLTVARASGSAMIGLRIKEGDDNPSQALLRLEGVTASMEMHVNNIGGLATARIEATGAPFILTRGGTAAANTLIKFDNTGTSAWAATVNGNFDGLTPTDVSVKLNNLQTMGATSTSAVLSVQNNGTRLLDVSPAATNVKSGAFIVATAHTPSSSTDTGVTGQVAWDSSFIYICIATNTWKRASIVTF